MMVGKEVTVRYLPDRPKVSEILELPDPLRGLPSRRPAILLHRIRPVAVWLIESPVI